MENIGVLLDFGGFYYSHHDYALETAVENFCLDDMGEFNQSEYENIDFTALYKAYSKEYIEKFNEWLNDELETEIELIYKSLRSPKFYNYSTDKICLEISEQDAKKVNSKLPENKDFLEYLKERTTSYPGFVSSYSFDEVMNNKDNVLINYILDFLSMQYNDEALTCSIYEVNVFEVVASEII